MKILVPVKRVVDYNVKVRSPTTASSATSTPSSPNSRQKSPRLRVRTAFPGRVASMREPGGPLLSQPTGTLMPKASRGPLEMEPLDLDTGWAQLPGFPDGLMVKLLADDLDEETKTGARTRLVRFAPGTFTTNPLIHDYWEEVILLQGQLALRAQPPQDGDRALTYSCRPPGTPHGPFISDEGCILLEFQYYLR